MTTAASTENLFDGLLKNKPAETGNVVANPTPGPSAAAAPGAVAGGAQDEPETAADASQMPSELDMLKNRARVMGLTFSNNISVETLRAKIKAKLEGESQASEAAQSENSEDGEGAGQQDAEDEITDDRDAKIAELQAKLAALQANEFGNVVGTPPASVTAAVKRYSGPMAERKRLRDEQLRLVRLRITNLNPAKKDLPGEIFTVANRFIGNVKKFIPYGEATDNGYHVPYCIYTQLKEREFQQIRVKKDSRGRERIETSWVREFALEELPQMTEIELQRLAAHQAASAGME